MADDAPAFNRSNNASEKQEQEVAICQQGRPNQAIFVSSLDITLEDFRTAITERGLTVPKEWVFTTDLGSLISEDQEDRIFLRSVARPYGSAVYIMLDPSMSMHQQQQRKKQLGRKDASSATTAGSVRNTNNNITSFETDHFERIIKCLRIIAILIALLIFTEMCTGVLYTVVEAWKYSLLTSQKHSVTGIPDNSNPVGELAKMQRQIDDL